jgi:hypothetical protein
LPASPDVLSGDGDWLLNRTQALLAQFDPLVPSERTDDRREVLRRIADAVALLRAEVGAQAAAVLEEARRERARLAAEIEILRAERDLCLSLVAEAGEMLRREPVAHQDRDAEAPGGNSAAGALGAADEPGPETADLGAASIAPGARTPVERISMTIGSLPGLAALFDLEAALGRIPAVRRCSVGSLRHGLARVDLILEPPTAPLVLAATLLRLPTCPLALVEVDGERVAARFAG